MKLGSKIYVGVQSLGRQDVGAQGALARSEIATIQSFNDVVQTGLAQASDITAKLDSNESDLLLSEQIRKDRKKILELNTYFDSQKAIDLEGDMPAEVKEVVNEFLKDEANQALVKDGRFIGSHRVRQLAMDKTIGMLQENSGKILQKRGKLDDYNTKMQGLWDTVGQSAIAGRITGQLEENKARAVEALHAAELALDEQAAMELIDEYENNGTFTPEMAAERRITLPTTIAYLKADQMLTNAQDESEVEAAMEQIPYEKLSSEQKLRLSTLEEKAYQNISRERVRRHESNMGELSVMAMNGTLSQAQIDQAIKSDGISYSHGVQLYNLLKQPKVVNSTPAIVNRFEKAITDIGVTDPFSPITVEEQASAIRMALRKAAYGDENNPPSINGEDYAAMVKALDDRAKSVKTKSGEYQEAKSLISRKMGITDFVDAALRKEDHYVMAYEDAILTLNDYMRSMGEAANPMKWWEENSAKFDPKSYKTKSYESLKKSFPEFMKPQYNLGFDNGVAQIDGPRMMSDAFQQMSSGRMHYWRYERLLRAINDYTSEAR